jgi:hypothetical protein
VRGHFSAQAEDLEAGGRQSLRKNGSEFSRGLVGNAPHVVDGLAGRSAGYKSDGHLKILHLHDAVLNSQVTDVRRDDMTAA